MTAAGWVTFLGVLITGLLGLLGALSSARANRRAAERSAELTSIKLQIEAREHQIDSWRQDAETLRRERDEDARACREKILELENRISTLTVVRSEVPRDE